MQPTFVDTRNIAMKNSDIKMALSTEDPTAESRKQDHIELAFQSQVEEHSLDKRFNYEPLLSGHPQGNEWKKFSFLGKEMGAPMWVSSMTGGTELAGTINKNLARACKDFGMGMGLGSCRSLLFDNTHLSDFAIRPLIGNDLPMFANLGIAQLEQLLDNQQGQLITDLVKKLEADGLIIHVNPMQEWLQPEGDRFKHAPLDTIKRVLDLVNFPVIVKEVGQGMGRESLKSLLQLPLAAIDFAANGGTNFAKLELLRSDKNQFATFKKLALLGHSAEEMVAITNELIVELGDKALCQEIIVSGGVKDFLDGYYLTEKLCVPAIYGQASAFLAQARGAYEPLQQYIEQQIRGLSLAKAFLTVK